MFPNFLRSQVLGRLATCEVTPIYHIYYYYRLASDPWNPLNPWKPWKTPQMVDTPKKVPEIPWKLGWSLKKSEKSLQNLAFTLKWLFWWPYIQFWSLNFCLRWAIIIIAYCITHYFFHFPLFVFIQVNRRMPVSTPELLLYEYLTMDLCYYWMIKSCPTMIVHSAS